MTTAATAEPMSSVDRAWLEMDGPRNPMVVSAIIELEAVASVASFARAMVERLLRYPRFRDRPEVKAGLPRWVPDQDFLGAYHLHILRQPARDGEAALHSAIEAELARDLDHGRPLWRIALFPKRGKRLTMLFRAHHALADGVALVELLMNCTDAAMRSARASAHVSTPAHPPHATHDGPLGGLIDRLEGVNDLVHGLIEVAKDDLLHPGRIVGQLRAGRTALAAMRRVVSLPQDNPAAFRKPLSGHRRVAWMCDLPFAPIRQLAHGMQVKVNDIFIAALSAAFGDELRAQGIEVPETQNLRVSIPVNLRGSGQGELGNCFGLVLLDLPVGVRDPLLGLRLVAERMADLKHSPEAKAVLASLAAAGHLPSSVEKKLVSMVGNKAVAVVSNLPGPKRRVRISGAQVTSLVFWPPQTGDIGIGVSLFSYAGHFSIGVSADSGLIRAPQRLLAAFLARLAELQASARPARKRRPA